MKSELKPCPFCGASLVGKYEVWRSRITGITAKHMVYTHTKTGCVLDYHRYHFYNDPTLEEKWNRRVGDDLMERMVDDGK